ncbi:hypothetical protein [Megasphaera sp.]|uniref:hypothetical protein n=1 Tax=Megasphaera sp. TaxID=2023260 RepID=UPI00307AC780
MIQISKENVHEWTFCNACGSINRVEFVIMGDGHVTSSVALCGACRKKLHELLGKEMEENDS